MSSRRPAMPKAVREQVLTEFNYLCAVCGKPKPQLHHIDNDNANNDSMNLIPLCPNHHLIDQHNPTRVIGPDKMRIFRIYKDPVILWPQFDPLFKRMKFLDEPNGDLGMLQHGVAELTAFMAELEMGNFYAKQVGRLLPSVALPKGRPMVVTGENLRRNAERKTQELAENQQAFRDRLVEHKEQVHELIVEMLRYQKWQKPVEEQIRV